MCPTPCTPFLEECQSPAFVCDSQGRLNWANHAFDRLFSAAGRPSRLHDFLGPVSLRRILGATHYASFEVQDAAQQILSLRPSAVVLSSLQPDPDLCARLVVLHSVPSLETGVAARQEYLASIAHDLKNPLGAIFGYADILLDTAAGDGLSERQRELVRRIRSTSLRSVDLVRNYQYLIALEDAPAAGGDVRADLHEVIGAVVESVWRRGDQNLDLAVELCATAPVVRMQRMEAERIFSNLFNNAIKYTPVPGRIVVKTWLNEGLGVLEVRNYPAYIPAPEQARIFERFRRAGTAGESSGTGLGLYIVKTIAERCGGIVALRSSGAEGTSFTVSLPLGDSFQEARRLKK